MHVCAVSGAWAKGRFRVSDHDDFRREVCAELDAAREQFAKGIARNVWCNGSFLFKPRPPLPWHRRALNRLRTAWYAARRAVALTVFPEARDWESFYDD